MSRTKICIEVCAGSAASAIAGQAGGADRIELCANLTEGGTTPSPGELQIARKYVKIPIFVMIRPRGGDFLYSALEYEIMRADIAMAKGLGADGVVLGILKADGAVDRARCQELVELARPLQVTFHRAFDMTADAHAALTDIVACGCSRILSSGQAADALQGASLLKKLMLAVGQRLSIMPGGGVNTDNIQTIIEQTGAREIHLTGQHEIVSAMAFTNPAIYMGVPGLPEYSRCETSTQLIERARRIVDQFG